ncbi:MAG: hypothetical protein MI700_00940 [Balneolales bacterium]|nr:hypothetical protein [Balneolales bacterium]
MELGDWYNSLYVLVSIPTLYLFIRLAFTQKSLAYAFFTVSTLSFLAGVVISYLVLPSEVAREWGDLVGITFVLCGLFVKIRDSKPVFARFPIVLTFLPTISIFFYPMIADASVIKNLLNITYQGGAIIVGLLLFGLNQLLHKKRMYLLVSCSLFFAAYIFYWFINDQDYIIYKDLSKILFSLGMVIAALGFRKSTITNE